VEEGNGTIEVDGIEEFCLEIGLTRDTTEGLGLTSLGLGVLMHLHEKFTLAQMCALWTQLDKLTDAEIDKMDAEGEMPVVVPANGGRNLGPVVPSYTPPEKKRA